MRSPARRRSRRVRPGLARAVCECRGGEAGAVVEGAPRGIAHARPVRLAALCVRPRQRAPPGGGPARHAQRGRLVVCDEGELAAAAAGGNRRARSRAGMRLDRRAGRREVRRAVRSTSFHAEFRLARRVRRGHRRRRARDARQPASAGAVGRTLPRPRNRPARGPRRGPWPPRQGEDRRRRFQVRPGAGPDRGIPPPRAPARRAYHRPARAPGLGHLRDRPLARGVRAARCLGRSLRARRHAQHRRWPGRALAAGRSRHRPRRAGCRAGRGEAGLPAIQAVAGAGPLPRGRSRRAAGARQPAQAEGRFPLRRHRHRHEFADPPGALRRLSRDREPQPPRRAGRGALPGGRTDLRIRRRARHQPPAAEVRGGRRASHRHGGRLRPRDGFALQSAASGGRGGGVSEVKDPKQARAFRFVRCAYADGVAELVYAFDEGPELIERIGFPSAPPLPAERGGALDAALHLLHLIAGVSYFKAGVPGEIRVETQPLDAATAGLLDAVYLHGLGEFAYQNKLDLRGKIQFPAHRHPGEGRDPAPALDLPQRTLVPIGGGKDSLVSVESLKAIGAEATAVWVGNSPLIAACAAHSGLPALNIRRDLSPVLFDYNRHGAYNGHIPVTAINSAILVVAAVLYGYDGIAFSNERSASSATLEYDGQAVNHQWSKSLEFERGLHDWVHAHVAGDLDYFSLLRPFSELAVTQRFARLAPYFPVFSSCNRNFKLLGPTPAARRCGQCPKCHFVFLALAPN